MSIYEIQPVALGGVKTYPIAARRSKVSVREFARPAGKNPSLKKFLEYTAGNSGGEMICGTCWRRCTGQRRRSEPCCGESAATSLRSGWGRC